MARKQPKPTYAERERTRLREFKATASALDRDQKIPPIKDPKRRKRLEKDDAKWLRFYLPQVFFNPFTDDQLQTIHEAVETLKYGTQKCRAMKRGGGKSSILRYLALKYALAHKVELAVLLCATGDKAKKALEAIKARLCVLPGDPLYDDYPLECHLARYVRAAPLKAKNLTVNGGRVVRMEWNAESIIMPVYEDEGTAIGPVIITMGITSDQLQGCNIYDVRPNWVLLDDLDSRDSLAAVDGTVADKLEKIIDYNVAGLGGPGKRLGLYMNCTVPSRNSLAWRYSDVQIKPSWSGVRVPAIKQWPTNLELWDRYIELRKNGKGTFGEDKLPIDPFGREAFRFYEANRAAMDEGAILSDPHDYNMDLLPDGSVMQLSALQRCFDYIADKDMPSFMTEWQNEPPDDSNVEVSGINARLVASRIADLERKQCPSETVLTAYCDTGKKHFHWVVTAWRAGAIGDVIDYGVHDVHGTDSNSSNQTLNRAILSALQDWRAQLLARGYKDAAGNDVPISMALINSAGADPKSGAWEDAVYAFCKEVGHPFHPSIGIGKTFNLGVNSTERKIGFHWYRSRQHRPGSPWLYCLHADFWKYFCHERFLTATWDAEGVRLPGSMALFKPALPREHHSYSQQICAEIWHEKFVEGKGLKVGWYEKSPNNHWFDATAGACAAANVCGIELIASNKPRSRSFAEMRAAAQRK